MYSFSLSLYLCERRVRKQQQKRIWPYRFNLKMIKLHFNGKVSIWRKLTQKCDIQLQVKNGDAIKFDENCADWINYFKMNDGMEPKVDGKLTLFHFWWLNMFGIQLYIIRLFPVSIVHSFRYLFEKLNCTIKLVKKCNVKKKLSSEKCLHI